MSKLFLTPMVVSAAVSAALAYYAWKRRFLSGALPFALLMLALTDWSLGYALELQSAVLPDKVFWAQVEYLGITAVPVLWLIFALQYTGQSKWLTKRNLALMAILPIITLVIAWSNQYHGLIWSEISLEVKGELSVLHIVYGRWFWVNIFYSYLLLLLGTILIIRMLIRSPHLYRGQSTALLIGASVPWVANIIYISGLNPFTDLDLTPFAFTITGLALAWGLFRFQLLDIVPVARDAIIENLHDGVIVLDTQNRIVDFNQSAQHLIDHSFEEATGQHIGPVFSMWPKVEERLNKTQEFSLEIMVGEGDKQDYINLHVSPLLDRRGRLRGKIIVLHDITERKIANQRLRESDDRFRQLSQATFEGILISENGIVLDANEQLLEMVGYHLNEIVGGRVLDLALPEYQELVRENIRSGYDKAYRVVAIRKDGQTFQVDVRGKTIQYQGQEVRVTAVRDITEQLRTDEALFRREAILEAVSFAAEQFLKSPHWENNIQEVLEQLGLAAGASRIYIFENQMNEDGRLFINQRCAWTAPGITPISDNPEPQCFPWQGGGFTRWRETLGDGHLIHGHVKEFPESEREALVAQDVLSIVVLPIFIDQKWWGFIRVDECIFERDWATAEIDALEAAASALGATIQRREVEEKLHQRVVAMAELHAVSLDITSSHDLPTLLQTIVARATRLLEGAGGSLFLCDPDRQEARCVVSHNTKQYFTGIVLKYGEGAAGIVAQTQKPLIIDDYRTWPGRATVYEERQPFMAVLSAPMIWQRQVIGVIQVFHNANNKRFTYEDLELLTLFASQAASSIENTHLYDAERQRAEELEALRATIADISAELELPKLLRAILERATKLLNATGGDLGLYNKRRKEIHVVVSYNMGKDYTGTRMVLGEGAMGEVAMTHRPLMIDNYHQWEGRSSQYESGPWDTVVAVPLLIGNRLVGVLGIVDSDPERRFSQSDQHLLALFAQQAAIAIENARLYAAEKQRSDELAILFESSTAITTSLDLPAVLNEAAEQFLKVTNATSAYILSCDLESGEATVLAEHYSSNANELERISDLNETHDLSEYPQTLMALRAGSTYISSVNDANIDPQARVELDAYGTKRTLEVPMMVSGEIHAYMEIWDSCTDVEWSEDQVRLCQIIANQTATAIEKAHLFSEMQRLAITDPLTGLYNRRHFYKLAEQELHRSRRYNHPLSAIMLDVDHFKHVNDTYGHAIGDEVLRSLAVICQNNLRHIDIHSRYGGEEFAFLLVETDLKGAQTVAERLRHRVAETPIMTKIGPVTVSISLGVAEATDDTPDLLSLLDHADVALYAAKQAGRNQVVSSTATVNAMGLRV